MFKLPKITNRILIFATSLSILVMVVLGCQTVEIKKAPSQGDIVANCPKMVVGDSWKYSGPDRGRGRDIYTGRIVYVEEDGGFDIEVTAKKQDYTRVSHYDSDCRRIYSPSGQRSLDFPLFVGKEWSEEYEDTDVTGKKRKYKDTCKVKGYEKVTTKAGTVEAFKIHRKHMIVSTSEFATSVYWYSPEVKFIVKEKPSWRIGRELISYSLVTSN